MRLSEQYRPQYLKDVKGHDAALAKIKASIAQRKPVFLHGMPGIGKTTIAHALARELDFEIIEVNASDTRNKEHIQEIIGNAAKQQSLFSKGKLILIDEVDGISGTYDRGGVPELVTILKEHRHHPIILTANDPWDSKLSSIRKESTMVELTPLQLITIVHVLQSIAEHEKLSVDGATLKKIAEFAGGDLRAAINDLESLSLTSKKITPDDVATLSQREQEQSIFTALRTIFKEEDARATLGVFDLVDIDSDELFLWIDENLPLEYNGKDLVQAYHALSTADIFKRRIQRWQHWRFLAYIYQFLTAGIAAAKDKKSAGYVGYRRTSRILKIWMANQKNFKKKAIAEVLAPELHASKKRIVKEVIPYLKIITQGQKDIQLGLDEEQMEWLRK